jgi:hypothetical protein
LATGDGRVNARAGYDEPGMHGDIAFVDAAVAPGHSGGPVFTGDGDFAGLVFARESHTGLAGVIDGDTVAAFLDGDGRSGDPAACEPDDHQP